VKKPGGGRLSLGVITLSLAAFAALSVSRADTPAPKKAPAPQPAHTWLDHARECLASVFSIEARFEHERISPSGGPAAITTGKLQLRRGARFRITYDTPKGQLLVSDGERVLAYSPENEAVIRAPVASTLLPKVFDLFIAPTPDEQWISRHLGGAHRLADGAAAIELLPRAADRFVDRFVLTVGPTCPAVERVVVVDSTGAAHRVTLSKIRTNVGMPAKLFTLDPPEGAQIIERP
jgi:outer membrane lipoprotein-sorting protein